MKPSKFLLMLVIGTIITGSLHAQNRQSIIYDAIAIQNALKGKNKIIMPAEGNTFDLIDPQSGEVKHNANESNLTENLIKSEEIILEILRRNANLPPVTSKEDVKKAYKDNPFISDILDIKPDKSLAFTFPPGFISGSEAGNALTKLGTQAANALSQVIIEHATKELAIAVFERLQKLLDRYPEFSILFPKTLKVIRNISPYDYEKFLALIKSNLGEDLDLFTVKLPSLYELPKYQLLNKKFPELTLIFSASRIASELDIKKNTPYVLANLDTAKFLTEPNNYASFIKVSSILAGSLQKRSFKDDAESQILYISLDDISQICNSAEAKKVLFRTYLGLLYAQTKSIIFYKSGQTFSFANLLQNIDNESTLIDKLLESTTKIQEIANNLNNIKSYDATGAQLSGKGFFSIERIEYYNKLSTSITGLIEPFLSHGTNENIVELQRMLNYWPSFSTAGINMYKNFKIKEYEAGIQNLSEILSSLEKYLKEKDEDKLTRAKLSSELLKALQKEERSLQDKKDALVATLNNLNEGKPAEDPKYIDMLAEQQELQRKIKTQNDKIAALNWQKNNTEKVLFSLNTVLDTYNLLAAMSKAEDSKQLEKVLEKYTLPAGSSRIKKDTDFNIAINAYVGGFFGRTNSNGSGFSNEYGLSAPIGFTLSHGFGKAGSLSAFAGAFDLGSVVRYKLDNQGEYQQDVNLAGLISPSVHIIYGLPWHIPISFGAGYQWTTPTTEASNNIRLRPHFNLFLAVDVPLFNLVVSKKRK